MPDAQMALTVLGCLAQRRLLEVATRARSAALAFFTTLGGVPRIVRVIVGRPVRCAAQKRKSERSDKSNRRCFHTGIDFIGGVTADAPPGRGA